MTRDGGAPGGADAGKADDTEEPVAPRHMPTQDEVQRALGAVLPRAKKCVSASEPISKATLVFQSDGSVLRVTVTGPAAGKPAEACIRRALAAASVPTFSDPTYTASVTVRGFE